jgi:uncharacterized protein YfbU (UPF0304 family)
MADDEVVEAPEISEGASEEPVAPGGESSDSGSWSKEQQAEFTRKSQALAEERKTWEGQRGSQQQQLQQYAQQLQQQQAAAGQQAQQQQGTDQQQSMLDQLAKMPYLDGPTAAELMRRIMVEGIQPLQQQLKQRDQALAQVYKDYKDLRNVVGKSYGKQAERDLDTRFEEIRTQQGLPDDEVIREIMRDIYYSHEGDDLNREFPEMVRKRLEGLNKTFKTRDRKAVETAKQSPFPSRGGEASPISGKTGGYKTPQDRADELWPMISPGQPE